MSKNPNFNFGQNWADYLLQVNDDDIDNAIIDLKNILGDDFIRDKSFIDIGCGSGIHSLAALKLGAKTIRCIDIDKKNTENTNKILSQYWKKNNFQIEQLDILKNNNFTQKYDIVYSWGVLHHTGDLKKAINITSKLCNTNSTLFLALYEKTIYCEYWKKIKRFYNESNSFIKKLMYTTYNIIKIFGICVALKNPITYIKNYRSNRGMNFWYDTKDWLGGYPYESINKPEVIDLLGDEFELKYFKKAPTGVFRSVFGTGCSIYVFYKV
tara:strand:- start:20183 stop:20986 length:804 start_codon:yes stop_codon:yes gene_type:complete